MPQLGQKKTSFPSNAFYLSIMTRKTEVPKSIKEEGKRGFLGVIKI
jgi:hypothetical protein